MSGPANPSFQRMLPGDLAVTPGLGFSKGAVQPLHTGAGVTPQVRHPASIAKRKSSGPLVNRHQRVSG